MQPLFTPCQRQAQITLAISKITVEVRYRLLINKRLTTVEDPAPFSEDRHRARFDDSVLGKASLDNMEMANHYHRSSSTRGGTYEQQSGPYYGRFG
jgi:hypothetical protein